MVQRISPLLLLAALILAGPAHGQEAEQPPTIFMSSWQCDRATMDKVIEMAQERGMPVAQDLVNEGKLWSYGLLAHDWGDEWNYVTLLVADDMNAGLEASTEMNRRLDEKYGEDDSFNFIDHCTTHRDHIYTGAFVTQENESVKIETPYSVAMSYFACPLAALDDIVTDDREVFLPAAQASVNEGHGYMAGAMTHAWADEWTYVLWRTAKDVPALLAFADDTGNRIEDDDPAPTIACRHRDNLYRMVAQTQAPPEQ